MSTISDREQYLNLSTWRKSGKEVRTPVWFAQDLSDPRRLWVYTNAKSGKVKRVRAGSRARVAACDMRGGVHGDWLDVSEIHLCEDPREIERGFDAIVRKYGWQMRLALFASRLSGRYADRAMLSVTV